MADKIIKKKKRTGKARPHFYKPNKDANAVVTKDKIKKKKIKKPRPSGDGDDGDVLPPEPTAATKERVAKLKERKRQLSSSDYAASRAIAAKVARLSAEEQADWLFQSFVNYSDVAQLERGVLTASSISPLLPGRGLEGNLKTLERSWQRELCTLNGRSPGEPSALFISPAALGALDMIRACPDIGGRCSIAKLFAKHIKLPEQAALLRGQPVCIGSGTPNRIAKLCDDGALKLDRLKWIVIDVRLDAKQRSILDMPEVRDDWWDLWQKHLEPRVKAGARVVLYGG